jgi:ribosomal protein L7Ae-like RNA K-turn-binding protein
VTDPGWIRLLGLGRRAGTVVIGSSGVRAGLQRDEFALVVLASDRSPRTDEKVGRLARGRAVPVLLGPAAGVLGRLFGRTDVQAVGVRDRKLALGIRAKVERNGSGGGSEQHTDS